MPIEVLCNVMNLSLSLSPLSLPLSPSLPLFLSPSFPSPCSHSLSLSLPQLNPTGKAKQSGVCEHDYILEINDTETQGITHHEAQQLIRTTGTTLTLLLSRLALMKGQLFWSIIISQINF